MTDKTDKFYPAIQVLMAIDERCRGTHEKAVEEITHLIDVWHGSEEPDPWAKELLGIAQRKIRAQVKQQLHRPDKDMS